MQAHLSSVNQHMRIFRWPSKKAYQNGDHELDEDHGFLARKCMEEVRVIYLNPSKDLSLLSTVVSAGWSLTPGEVPLRV